MTSLSQDFFDRQNAIKEKLIAEGHIPIGQFMSVHSLDISDLCFIGLIDEITPLAGMSPYRVSKAGEEYFINPGAELIFVNSEKVNELLIFLESNPLIEKRAKERAAKKEKQIAREIEKKRIAQEREEQEREREREREILQQSNSKNEDSNSINQTAESADSNKTLKEESRDPNITLMAAVPSSLFFLAMLFRVVSTSKPIEISDWLLLSAFGFYPIKYIFTFGHENIIPHFKTIGIWLVVFIISITIISKCSDEGGNGNQDCYYRVGC